MSSVKRDMSSQAPHLAGRQAGRLHFTLTPHLLLPSSDNFCSLTN